jgi:hypothetical protein
MYDSSYNAATDEITIPVGDSPVTTPFGGGETGSVIGELYAEDNGVLRIAGRPRIAVAAAVSCLVQPQPGDRVRALVHDGQYFITDILLRDAAAPLMLGDEQRAVTFRARNLSLVADEQLSLRAPSLSVFARAAYWVSDSLRQVARSLRIEAGHAHRQVEHVDSVNAQHVVQNASQSMALRSRVGSIQADGVLRIDGGQVHMG